MHKVCWIFRSEKRKEHSIENVFDNIEKYIEKEYDIEKYFLPEERYFSVSKLCNCLNYTKKISGDIYHITGEVNFCALVTPKDRTIITIHDYVILHRYKGFKKLFAWLFLFYLPFKRAKYLTCISQATYEETIKRFPWCEKKLKLIVDPISDAYQFERKDFNKEKPTILLIGANPNKNLERVIPAISKIKAKIDIIGKLSDEQINLLKDNDIEYTISSNISNEEVVEHYKNCDMVSFASTYEGFGMIIVEAQAVGRPVVTSNIEPMLTVAGGAAELVDPYSAETIRKGINKVIDDENHRENLIKSGLENCKSYRAEQVSKSYCEEYSECIKGQKRK